MDLTIAVIGPLASAEAVVAQPMLTAVRAAVHAAGPVFGGRVAVRELDDRRDPHLAEQLVQRCIDDPDVIGVVGPKNSGSALAAQDLACAAGLPLLLPAATADLLSGPGTSLRLCARDTATATAAARLVRGLAVRSLWVEADETAYGRRLASAVRTAVGRSRIPLAITPDGADAAFLAMGEVEQAERIVALRASGFAGELIGAEGGPGALIGELAGDAAEGSWQLYPGTHAPGHRHVYTAESSAAATALLRAYDATGDRTEIATWLRQRDREVIGSELGPLWFDADGERDGASVGLWRIEGGRSRPVSLHPVGAVAPSA
jgi:ABC-type branched-subunit amino acid transport system substrate-binding protein